MIRALFDLVVFAGMICLVLGVVGYLADDARKEKE